MIPQFDPATGRLPFTGDVSTSVYKCSMEEVAETFAAEMPNPRWRMLLLTTFAAWRSQLTEWLPGARVWLSGSFLTAKTKPSDLDVLVWWSEHHTELYTAGLLGGERTHLFTLHNVQSPHLGQWVVGRLQPALGLVDAHFAPAHLEAAREFWEHSWTSEFDKETGLATGVRMGVLEVVS